MQYQQEWEILPDQLTNELWEMVYQRFSFSPDYFAKDSRYSLKEPHDLYSCKGVAMIADSDPKWRETIRGIFCSCLNDQEYMYVLDWQHTCYEYYPRVKTRKKNPTFILDSEDADGGYYTYFPEFYPSGDYYLFFSRDLSWGYLTDPWRQEIFVYGKQLRKEIKNKVRGLGFTLIETSDCDKDYESNTN